MATLASERSSKCSENAQGLYTQPLPHWIRHSFHFIAYLRITFYKSKHTFLPSGIQAHSHFCIIQVEGWQNDVTVVIFVTVYSYGS